MKTEKMDGSGRREGGGQIGGQGKGKESHWFVSSDG